MAAYHTAAAAYVWMDLGLDRDAWCQVVRQHVGSMKQGESRRCFAVL